MRRPQPGGERSQPCSTKKIASRYTRLASRGKPRALAACALGIFGAESVVGTGRSLLRYSLRSGSKALPPPRLGMGLTMSTDTSSGRDLMNKVPEVTIYFWVIKVLCTTVGETAADFLNTNLNLGLTSTSVIMGAALILALVFQFMRKRYVPAIYWLSVVLISVVGTLITDNLTDNFGVSLQTTTAVFAVALAAVFAIWFSFERTLSIHSIVTRRREAFYWLAILFTFALGTAAGDLAAESLKLGYLTSAVIFGGLIAVVAAIYFFAKLLLGAEHRRMSANSVWAFWIAYILTRPLGASIGDLLSQSRADGGWGLGTTSTSAAFLAAILATVAYLAVTKKDLTPQAQLGADVAEPRP